MTFGSLFAGIGGFDLALERAGMRPLWQVEINRHCRRLLASRFPETERVEDVRSVGPTIAGVDLICGGFPCQDISVAGGRAGLAGERSGLWFEFHRILECARPRWVIVENVPGLFPSGPRDEAGANLSPGLDFAIVLSGLVQLGYCVAWRVLDARHFGVPQRRRRVFIVGHIGTGSAAQVLFESESVPGNHSTRGAEGQAVAPTISGRTQGGGGLGTDSGLDGGLVVSPTLRANPGGTAQAHNVALVPMGVQENQRGELVLSDLAPAIGGGGGKPGQGFAAVLDGVSATVSAKWAKGSAGPAGDETQNLLVADTLTSGSGWTVDHGGKGYGTHNLIDEGIAATVRSNPRNNSNPGTEARMHVQCAAGVRRLTPLECERLQGFPDGWTDGHKDTRRYKMLGNAVCVPVVEWIARRIVAADAAMRRDSST